MSDALALCHAYAPWNLPVLLLGPVGAGKTTLARELHAASGRAGDLVVVPSGDLVESLHSSTLFGHVRGSFTGAHQARAGAFLKAAMGTLLVDDLALTSLGAQGTLLRVLEDRHYTPLGSDQVRVASCRVLFASTVAPTDLVAEGKMLPDFESRVGELVVRVPALRERREDIVPLALHFARDLLASHAIEVPVTLAEEAMELLLTYPWPGNLRELWGVITRAVIHAHGGSTIVIRPAHLPDKVRYSSPAPSVSKSIPVSEMARMLERTGGNKAEAARRLGVHRNTLARRLEKLDAS